MRFFALRMGRPLATIFAACVLLGGFTLLPARASAGINPEISLGSTGLGISGNVDLRQGRALRLEYDAIDFGGYKEVTHTDDTLMPSGSTPIGAQIVFDDTFHTSNISVILDQHLPRSPLYLSAGLTIDLNRIDANSRPSESMFEYNGSNVAGDTFGPANVRIRWSPLAPYFGVGYQRIIKDGDGRVHRSVRFEIGAFAQGSRRISVQTSGVVAANPAIFQPYVDAFLAAVPNYAPRLALYPVIRLSVPIGH